MVQQSFRLLIEKFPDDDFIFMGDSAGGGLALAFAQKLVNEKASKLPIKNFFFAVGRSSMTNPLITIRKVSIKFAT
jgi:surfactin synthase thioesterase subunit